MTSQSQQVKKAVIENIKRDMASFGILDDELNRRVTVRMDVDQFDSNEDESVWLQKKGKAPFVCEVYFDNVWMCDLHESASHHKLRQQFFTGFLNAYENNRIRLNQLLGIQLDEMEQAAKKQAQKEFDKSISDLPESTPDEKASKEIIKELVKEKNDE